MRSPSKVANSASLRARAATSGEAGRSRPTHLTCGSNRRKTSTESPAPQPRSSTRAGPVRPRRRRYHSPTYHSATTCPTVNIGQRYRGRVAVSHLDLYRLEHPEEEDPALLDEYLSGDSVVFVEWPERGDPGVGAVTARVRLEHRGGDRRRVTLT